MICLIRRWRAHRAAQIAAEQADYKAQRDAAFARWRERGKG
jgi:hypothetical protein